jgi:opine dehydrogenase
MYAPIEHARLLRAFLSNGSQAKLITRRTGTAAICKIDGEVFIGSLDELVSYADVIYNTTPINAHDDLFQRVYKAAVVFRKRLSFINLAGGFSIFAHLLTQSGGPQLVNLGSMHTLPYACRVSDSAANVLNVRRSTSASFTCPTDIQHVALLEDLFGGRISADPRMLHMSLDRSSYVMHPLLTLFNLSRVECGDEFYLYRDGFCRSLNRLMIAAGHERMELARRLGYSDYLSPEERLKRFHNDYSADFHDIRAPLTLDHRYVTEDVACGLVPIVSLGEALGIAMPVCRSIIEIACASTGCNFWNSTYNLAHNRALKRMFLLNV